MNQLENSAKTALSGLTGMFKEVESLINKAKKDLETDEQKKEWFKKMEQSGILTEFETIREKLKDLHK